MKRLCGVVGWRRRLRGWRGVRSVPWILASVTALACWTQVTCAQTPPDTWEQSVTYAGQTITLRMTKQSVRGPHFEVLVQNEAGGYDAYVPGPVRTYLGTVDEDPAAVACGYLDTDGRFLSEVFFDRGQRTWRAEESTVISTAGNQFPTLAYPTKPTVTQGHAGTTTYQYEVGFDLDNRAFTQGWGSDVDQAIKGVERTLNRVQLIYLRDLLLQPVAARIIVRASQAHDPYDGTTASGILLGYVGTEWTSNQADACAYCHKIALVTAAFGGGLAYCPGKFSVTGMSTSAGLFYATWRHEVGHNWGMLDFDGGSPEGNTIMCGNGIGRYGGTEVETALSNRDGNLSNLTDLGIYATVDLTPYPALDVLPKMNCGLPIASRIIDVMGNDFDANGHGLSIIAYDSVSRQSGTVTRSAGSGPGGRDQLVYSPSPDLGLHELDTFYYTIQCSAGHTQTGVVMGVTEIMHDLLLYWPLEETTGTIAGDLSRRGLNGTLIGTDFASGSVTGRFGNALYFDGSPSRLYTEIDESFPAFTVSLWVKAATTEQPNQAAVFSSFPSDYDFDIQGYGENYRYSGSVEADIGALTTDWVHLALSCDGTSTRLYYNGSFVGSVAVADTDFGMLAVGAGWGSSSFFNGTIDEVRLYDLQLTDAQIQDLYDGDIWAHSPCPRDGAVGVKPVSLSWVSYPQAVQYQVYWGTNPTGVQNADTGFPEYLGATTDTLYAAPWMDPGATYYWRVDTVLSDRTIAGVVWSFVSGGSRALFTPPLWDPSFEGVIVKPSQWTSQIPGWYNSIGQTSTIWDGFAPADIPSTPYGDNWLELFQNKWVYQQVGHWIPDTTCEVSLLLGARAIAAFTGAKVNLWVGGDPALAADGVTLSSIGATIIADSGLIMPAIAGPGSEEQKVTLSTGSGYTLGDPLWLQVQQGGAVGRTLVDNVRIFPPPSVMSIVCVSGNPTSASSVDFAVTFSESVTGVDAGDFILATSGVIGATVTNVAGSDATRMVTVNTGSDDGTIRLDVVDDDTIRDLTDNPLGGPGAGNGNFSTGEVYVVERPTPTHTPTITNTPTETPVDTATPTATFTDIVTPTHTATQTTTETSTATFTATPIPTVTCTPTLPLTAGFDGAEWMLYP